MSEDDQKQVRGNRRDDEHGSEETESGHRDQDEPPEKGDGENDRKQADKDAKGNDEDEDKPEDDRSAKEKATAWLRTPKHKLIALAVLAILILATIAGILWWLEARKWKKTDNAYIRGPIARLSPGVSGNVTRVFVVDNQVVQAGQPLAAISVGSYDMRCARPRRSERRSKRRCCRPRPGW